MDPRYHVADLREVRLLVSGAQSSHGVSAGAATHRGEGCVQRHNRRPARRVSGIRIGDRGRSGLGRCGQASALRGADHRRARAAVDYRAAQLRIRLRKQRDQANRVDQFDRDRAVIPGSGGIDSEGEEISPIRIDPGGCIIGEVVAAAMRAVRRKEAEYVILPYWTEACSIDLVQ